MASGVPLLTEWSRKKGEEEGRGCRRRLPTLAREAWEESKKLWEIVGPAIFQRLVMYSFSIVSQAFAGHIDDLELAAFSIANNVISGLNFGFLVPKRSESASWSPADATPPLSFLLLLTSSQPESTQPMEKRSPLSSKSSPIEPLWPSTADAVGTKHGFTVRRALADVYRNLPCLRLTRATTSKLEARTGYSGLENVSALQLTACASASTATSVVCVRLGMASALETLCGLAYGAKQYSMLGIYLQRSWIILLVSAVLLVPTYVFTEPLLAAMGQPAALAREAGMVSVYMLPLHFMYAVLLPLNKFLQSQRKNWMMAATTAAVFPVHFAASWLLVSRFRLGVFGAAIALNVSLGLVVLLQLAYVVGGGCPVTWKGFSPLAFVDLCGFVKLSVSSGVMVCLETWYYRILILLTGHLKNSQLAVDALSIWVRVANELGAGDGKAARFATIVSTTTSFLIGLFFSVLALAFHDKIALVMSSSQAVVDAVDSISVLLALTVLLNGVQPVLSGVAVGSGWQAMVAYVNVGCYYLIGIPIGVLLGWRFNLGVLTLILAYVIMRCDWNKEVWKASERVQRMGISSK
ncbi:hypothetical protein GUJ93_ZPchr0002g24568 [Zizania palustris]|uniref:Protein DETOXIFICATION n=1 Tax=Zizania palustris TaxID=103762 RepID=A0A8J5SLB4_ZIZPA|nr:hypothetical protein GUJ93_ZPchr0002g24568 [Zizania palustris]